MEDLNPTNSHEVGNITPLTHRDLIRPLDKTAIKTRYLRPDGTPVSPPKGRLLLGRVGLILRDGDTCLKIPLVTDCTHRSENERELEIIISQENHYFLENEKSVYRRLGNAHDGIVKFLSLSPEGIQMPFMARGTLEDYISNHKLNQSLKSRWIQSIAGAVSYAHTRNVIIVDVASKNILIDDNMSVQLCDFSDSILLQMTSSMAAAVVDGMCVETDIFQFGSVAYEIVTGEQYEYELGDREAGEDAEVVGTNCVASFPLQAELPATEEIPYGTIIRTCWKFGGYQNMDEVCDKLRHCNEL